MTYVYRDPERLRRHPVDVPQPPATAPPDPEAVPPAPKPAPAPAPKPRPKRKLKPLPPPLWGGRIGLELASVEVLDWERRNPRHQPPEREEP